jgi:hypothetical protein
VIRIAFVDRFSCQKEESLMTTSPPQALRLVFVDADPAQPDAAAIGEVARTVVRGLQGQGETLIPAYTGEKGATEIFLWALTVSTTLQGLMAIPEFALKIAQLLNEIKKLRGEQETTAIVATPEKMVTLVSTAPLSDEEVLAQLLAAGLPEQIELATTQVTVAVPPTPPNEI